MSEKDVSISIPKQWLKKLWPAALTALLGAGGVAGGHALTSGEPRESIKVAVLESQMGEVKESLKRIERKLDKWDAE